MKWRIDQFNGMNPSADDSKLADGMASDCVDVHLEYGTLVGLKLPTDTATFVPVTTKFIMTDDVGRIYVSDNLVYGIAQSSAYGLDMVYTSEDVRSGAATLPITLTPPDSITVTVTTNARRDRTHDSSFQHVAHLWKRFEEIADPAGAENPIYSHINILHTDDSTIDTLTEIPTELKDRIEISPVALASDKLKGVDAATSGTTDDEYELNENSFLGNIAANYGVTPESIEDAQEANALKDIADCGETPTPVTETTPFHALFDSDAHAEIYPNFIPTAYTITFIDALGRESAPCEPISLLDPKESDFLPEITMPSIPVGVTKINVYRATANAYKNNDPTAGQSNYLLIAQLPPDTVSWVDSVELDDSGHHLLTTHPYYETTSLPLLTETDSGMLVSGSGNVINISLKHYWHGWLDRRQVTLRKGAVILDIVSFNDMLLVMTMTGNYTVMTGQDSGIGGLEMAVREIHTPLIMKAGIRAVKTEFGCMYVSEHGLIAFDGSSTKSLTERLIAPREWETYHSTCTCITAYRGKMYVFYGEGCLVLNLPDGVFGSQIVDFVRKSSVTALACCHTNDSRLLLVDVTGVLKIWQPDLPDDSTIWYWQSRDQELSRRGQFTAGRITGDFVGVLRIYTDGALSDTFDKIASRTTSFRIRRTTAETSLRLELEGQGTVRSVTLASSKTVLHRI